MSIEADKEHSGDSVFSDEDVKVIDCKTCMFKHVMPLPDQKEYFNYYNHRRWQRLEHFVEAGMSNCLGSSPLSDNEFQSDRRIAEWMGQLAHCSDAPSRFVNRTTLCPV